MKIQHGFVLLVASSVGYRDVVSASGGDNDDNRLVIDLEGGTRKGGVTYIDQLDLHVVSEMDVAREHVSSIADMSMTSEMSVQDLAGGGQGIDVTTTAFQMKSETMGQTFLSCDSDHRDEEDSSPLCEPLFSIIGVEQHFVVDNHGTVAEQPPPSSSDNKNSGIGNQQISPLQQLQQTSRSLNFLPTYPANIGDSWDLDVDLVEDAGHLTGTAKLIEYDDYEGHDCAVITIDGTMKVDIKKAMEKALGGQQMPMFGDMMKDISMSDVKIEAKLYWDNVEQIARYSKFSETMKMTMKNPMDGSDMVIDIYETATGKTEIKDEKQ